MYVPYRAARQIAREDRFGRGGDHDAFNRRGFAGVRISESRENYSRQHSPNDTPGGVDVAYLAGNARMNASPGAVGYRIVWREAWTPDWQFERRVGDATEATLADLSIDDHVLGVAAVHANGHESLVSAYVRPPRPRSDIQEAR